MIKFLKNVDWERVGEAVAFIAAAIIGTILITTCFIMAKAIIEAVF